MTDNNLDRYHRQILLPGIGQQGQEMLLRSKALIIGCGALGTVIANMLARAGVGHLVIIDRDFIEITNLQRQVLFDEQDVHDAIPKAEAAKRKIAKINSQIQVTAIVDDLNHTNIEKIAQGCDVLVDGVDNFETRFLANDCAVKLGIPYIYGGAVGTVGMTYAILPHTQSGDSPWEQKCLATPCLRCIFEQAPPPGMNPTCDTAGVLGSVVAIVANYQVNETIKVLTANFDAVNPSMISIDTWLNTTRQLKVRRAYDVGQCVCCKNRDFQFLAGKFTSATTTLCGRNAVQLMHKNTDNDGNNTLDFDDIASRLKAHGQVTANKFMLRAQITDNSQAYELTLFTDGRAIIKGTKDANTAKSIYAKYIGA